MKVIAYYTKETPYEKEIENLRKSLEEFDIEYEFEGYACRGKWVLNCGIKPEFILKMLKKYPGEVLMYIDADAVVRRPLVLAQGFNAGFAVHHRRRREVLSGTLILRSISPVITMVQRWADYQSVNKNLPDQQTLSIVIKEKVWPGVEIIELPSAYVKIHDAKDMDPNPVIEHFQASRKHKHQLDLQITLPRGIRLNQGGQLWLPRPIPKLIAWLDARYTRIGKELIWLPHELGQSDICRGDYNGTYEGKVGYIVGKGPSLDLLAREDFEDGPVFAVNEAIRVVQELCLPNDTFSVIDPPLKDTVHVDHGITVLANIETGWYPRHPKRKTYSTLKLNLTQTPLTAEISIKILQKMKVSKIIFLCFDASMGGSLEYAKSVGYDATKGGAVERFKRHRLRFEQKLLNTPHEFREVVNKASDDTPQP